ncbi:hypothetical protein KY363_05830 [Candidatus Woesearchaeota archaeon]|nr:hypothetical protein [Candidatus Woesearchaeota archaeon]
MKKELIILLVISAFIISITGCATEEQTKEMTQRPAAAQQAAQPSTGAAEETTQYVIEEPADTSAYDKDSSGKGSVMDKTTSTASQEVQTSTTQSGVITLNPSPPKKTSRLIFIHHSTGENWLTDGYGNLGKTLDKNNYFVSDTNYGWGPDSIGDTTDIVDWPEWFRSASTPTYMSALYKETEQNSDYTRTLNNPGGENEIIMFKSCFPNSEIEGSPDDDAEQGDGLTVSNAKYIYNDILKYFRSHPEKLFIVITAPPVSNDEYAENARAFNNWLVNDWLDSYEGDNVKVFDFYNLLTAKDSHHRYNDGAIEHTTVSGKNTLYYPSDDDHPSVAGSQKATAEFVPWLNVMVNCWKGDGACP